MIGPEASVSEQTLRSCAVACLRAPNEPEAAAQVRQAFFDPSFDWPAFTQLVHNERIAPLIHHSIGGWGLFPPGAADSFRRAYLQNAWLNDLRLEELYNILGSLQGENIPVVLLKGVALIYTVYERSALRPMSDIDLLIPSIDMEKAQQILQSQGYARVIASPITKEFESEAPFQKSGQHPWHVDLHSSLLNVPHRLSHEQMDWFWENKELVIKNDQEVWIFNINAQLLYLSAHIWLHHGGGDLLGMNDIYQLICKNHERIDWEKILFVGKELEFLLPLQHVLSEIAITWKAPIPEHILARFIEMKASVREKRKFKKLKGEDQNYAKILVAETMSYPDWKSRIQYITIIAFPPVQYIKERYKVQSRWMIPYYYFHRIAARAAQQVSRVLNKVLRSSL